MDNYERLSLPTPVSGSHREEPPKLGRTSSPARLETLPMFNSEKIPLNIRINEALLEVTRRCTNDPQNQSPWFALTSVRQEKTVLVQRWITVSYVDADGTVWVKDDPISFEKYDRRLNSDYDNPCIHTQYGPITKQMDVDINLRPPIVDDLELENKLDKRAEILWGHIKEKAEKEGKLPPMLARNVALYAIAGMIQNFEGPSIYRIKKYAQETFFERKLVDSNDRLEVCQTTLRRTFTTQVIGDGIQVIGTNFVTLMVFPSDLSDPYTLGTIMTIRRYSVVCDGINYHSHRDPDVYHIGVEWLS